MNTKFKHYLNTGIVPICGYYLLYSLIVLFIYYMLTSITISLHFLLEQHFSVIDSWVERHNFSLVTFSKLISFFITIKFIQLRDMEKRSIKELYKECRLNLNYYAFAVILYYWVIMLIFWVPEIQWHKHTVIELSMLWDASWGSFFFYFFDFLIIISNLNLVKNEYYRSRFLFLVAHLVLFVLVAKGVVPYKKSFPMTALANFSLLLAVSMSGSKNIGDGIGLILLIVLPHNVLFGMNIFWGDAFAPFIFKNLNDTVFLMTSILAFVYILLHDKVFNIKIREKLFVRRNHIQEGE